MKLSTFQANGHKQFGFKFNAYLIPFATFQYSLYDQHLASIDAYLSDIDTALPLAQKAYEQATETFEQLTQGKDYFAETDVELLKPIDRPTMFYDVLTSPTHAYLSGKTALKYEMPKIVSMLFGEFLLRKQKQQTKDLSTPEVIEYYKGNAHSFGKSGDMLAWPEYTSYLDIEPELMFVSGYSKMNKVAGFLVLNDCSARDIQFPEMKGGLGPQRAKDFQNIMSPYIVTPDEINPYDLEVEITIGNRHLWTGRTDKYSATAEQIIAYMEKICEVQPGTFFGMGTIPRCTCMDNDIWVNPGERIIIEFKGLGKMEHIISDNFVLNTKQATRWGRRKELKQFYA